MEQYLFVAFVIIIVLLIGIKSEQKKAIDLLNNSFLALKKEIEIIKEKLNDVTFSKEDYYNDNKIFNKNIEITPDSILEQPINVPIEKPIEIIPETIPEPILVPVINKMIIVEPIKEVETQTVVNDLSEQPSQRVESLESVESVESVEEQPQTKQIEYPEPEENWWDKLVRNNPDVEKFIGENLFNKIGIAILVLGIIFFVKYDTIP